MMRYLIIVLGVLLYNAASFSYAASVTAPPVWEKVSADEGVIVYAQEIDGSEIIKVKTRVVINAPMKQILSILDDVPHRKDWIPYLEESRILKTISATEKMEYSLFAAPWPASDRDFVYSLSLAHRDKEKVIYSMKSDINDLMPENEDQVRAELIESQYTLTVIDENQTNVELIFYADPKGWLPNWIINIIQKVLPYRMLRNLRDKAEGKTNGREVIETEFFN